MRFFAGDAVKKAAVSGNPKFFLGTDSAPHSIDMKVEDANGREHRGLSDDMVAIGIELWMRRYLQCPCGVVRLCRSI